MAPRCVSELFTIKSTTNAQETVILNYPALIQWPMEGIRCARKGPFIWSKVSSELRNLKSLKAFEKHIHGVDLSFMIMSSTCTQCIIEDVI